MQNRFRVGAAVPWLLWAGSLSSQPAGEDFEWFGPAFERAIAESSVMTAIAEAEPEALARMRESLLQTIMVGSGDDVDQAQYERALGQYIANTSLQLLAPMLLKYGGHADDESIYDYYRTQLDMQGHAFEARLQTCVDMLEGNGTELMRFFLQSLDDPEVAKLIDAQRDAGAALIRSGAGFPERDVATLGELENYLENLSAGNPALASALESEDQTEAGYRLRCDGYITMFRTIVAEPSHIGAPLLRAITDLAQSP